MFNTFNGESKFIQPRSKIEDMSVPFGGVTSVVTDNCIFSRCFFKFCWYWKLFLHIVADRNRILTWFNVHCKLFWCVWFLNQIGYHIWDSICLMLQLIECLINCSRFGCCGVTLWHNLVLIVFWHNLSFFFKVFY